MSESLTATELVEAALEGDHPEARVLRMIEHTLLELDAETITIRRRSQAVMNTTGSLQVVLDAGQMTPSNATTVTDSVQALTAALATYQGLVEKLRTLFLVLNDRDLRTALRDAL